MMPGAVVGTVAVVVPCFNEAHRLDLDRFDVLTQQQGLRVLFVDDGSTDTTAQLLDAWASSRPAVELLRLPDNVGKGEAIRAGFTQVIDSADIVAYLDADLASPPSELLRVVDIVRRCDDIDVAMGSRVALLGAHIERSRLRHYQGRVFATLASVALRLPVYDTQCGLKVIRTTPALRAAIATPLRSRWVFDVELLARMLHATPPLRSDRIREAPLREWRDVSGSRLSPAARLRAVWDLYLVTR